jgi:hypothetical protein
MIEERSNGWYWFSTRDVVQGPAQNAAEAARYADYLESPHAMVRLVTGLTISDSDCLASGHWNAQRAVRSTGPITRARARAACAEAINIRRILDEYHERVCTYVELPVEERTVTEALRRGIKVGYPGSRGEAYPAIEAAGKLIRLIDDRYTDT